MRLTLAMMAARLATGWQRCGVALCFCLARTDARAGFRRSEANEISRTVTHAGSHSYLSFGQPDGAGKEDRATVGQYFK